MQVTMRERKTSELASTFTVTVIGRYKPDRYGHLTVDSATFEDHFEKIAPSNVRLLSIKEGWLLVETTLQKESVHAVTILQYKVWSLIRRKS
jgi:hypothetical protein